MIKNIDKKDFYTTLQSATKKLSSQERSKNNNKKTSKKVINDLHKCFAAKENLLNNLSLYKNNKDILLKPSKSDIIVSIWWKEISLLQEYKEFTQQDISLSFAYVQAKKQQDFGCSGKTYWQEYSKKHPEHEKDILQSYYAKSRDELWDHMISIPISTFTSSSAYTLAAISHELWHIFANHLWKHLIDYERNANAFSMRFIRYIERKYNINTYVLENELYKTALASYQLRYLLHQHDSSFLENNDNRYIHHKHKYDELWQQTDKNFL